MEEKNGEMEVSIDDEGVKRIEHISAHQQLLLRAAYIACFIRESNTFPHGQKKDFDQLQSWPIKIPKENPDEKTQELIKNINEWFESNLLQTTKAFIYHPLKLHRMYKLIRESISLPEEEKDIVPAWMLEEIFNCTANAISQEAKNIFRKK